MSDNITVARLKLKDVQYGKATEVLSATAGHALGGMINKYRHLRMLLTISLLCLFLYPGVL